jgi:hypothetical protein
MTLNALTPHKSEATLGASTKEFEWSLIHTSANLGDIRGAVYPNKVITWR